METTSSHVDGKTALYVLHYTLPLSIFVYYSVASLIAVCVQRKEASKDTSRNALQKTVLSLMISVLLTYFAEAITLLVASFVSDDESFSKDNLICIILSNLAWFVLAAGIVDSPPPVRYPFTGSWIISFSLETAILILTILCESPARSIKYTRLTFQLVRLCGLAVLSGIAIFLLWPLKLTPKSQKTTPDERRPLLSSENDQSQATGENYGSVDSQPVDGPHSSTENEDVEKNAKDEDGDVDDDDDDYDKNIAKVKGDWWSYAKTFAVYLPVMWPKGSRSNQFRLLGCVLCMACVRALNILKPRQYGIMVNALTHPDGTKSWIQPIILLSIFNLLSSSAGVPMVKAYLWLPVDRNMTARLSERAYNHVMSLSSDFHDSKRSGPLWYSIYNARSVTEMLEMVFFKFLPVIFDFTLAATYIYYEFDPYLALIVFGTAVMYLWSSTAIVARQNIMRRRRKETWKTQYSILTETTSNWRTVSYFNRISHEQGRYATALKNDTIANILSALWHYFEYAIKSCIMELGLLLILIIAGYHVVHGAPIGNVVVLMSFWSQITYPLAVIADSFDRVASTLVDAEDLLKVLNKEPSIRDKEDVKPLDLKQGEIEFESVGFSYDKKRDILKKVSLRATPGQTIALVGETGGGKSTILKLLFRFYDVTSGSIKIDGQDIRDVTTDSLRQIIGNVPQDATLFNDTVMNNVRYAKIDATDEEVFEACKAAAIHDKVMSFSKGYHTKVGEGGTKLSGGELQRLAIARAILQDPQIVLLDEATSSVDTETEAHIQESLRKLTCGRTTFVIAHRLSTIVNADLILVISKGEIVERGTHQKLMSIKGKYHNLWTKQMVPNAERKKRELEEREFGGSDYLNDLDSTRDDSPKKSTRDSGGFDDDDDRFKISTQDSSNHGDEANDGNFSPATEQSVQDDSLNKGQDTDKEVAPAPEKSGGKEKASGQEKTKSGNEKGNGSMLKRFWRPDAPEFIPKGLGLGLQSKKDLQEGKSESASREDGNGKEPATKDGEGTMETKGSPSRPKGKQTASYLSDTAGEYCQKHGKGKHHHHHDHLSLSKSPSKRTSAQTSEAQADGAIPLGDSEDTADMSNQETSTFEEPSQDTPKLKKRRFYRRNQSKSEPAGHGQTDGTDEPQLIPEGSGESQATRISKGNRRVSAPSDPPRGRDIGTGGLAPRRRRRRQWKRKTQGSSNAQSTDTTGSASMGLASPGSYTPAPPPTSPAAGVIG